MAAVSAVSTSMLPFLSTALMAMLSCSCHAMAKSQHRQRDHLGCAANHSRESRLACIERSNRGAASVRSFPEPSSANARCGATVQSSTILMGAPHCAPARPLGTHGLEIFIALDGEGGEATFVRFRTSERSWSFAILFETVSSSGGNVESIGECTESESCGGFLFLRCPVDAVVDGAEVPDYERDHVIMTFVRSSDVMRPELWMRDSRARVDGLMECYM